MQYDYRTKIFPLNHFALWTKSWYEKVHKSKDQNTALFEELKSILALDDYSTSYMNIADMASIIIGVFDTYNKWLGETNNSNYLTIRNFINSCEEYKRYGYGLYESMIMVIRQQIQNADAKSICLSKPSYSKEIYKKYDLVLGDLLSWIKHGQTYKQMNDYVKKYNW